MLASHDLDDAVADAPETCLEALLRELETVVRDRQRIEPRDALDALRAAYGDQFDELLAAADGLGLRQEMLAVRVVVGLSKIKTRRGQAGATDTVLRALEPLERDADRAIEALARFADVVGRGDVLVDEFRRRHAPAYDWFFGLQGLLEEVRRRVALAGERDRESSHFRGASIEKCPIP